MEEESGRSPGGAWVDEEEEEEVSRRRREGGRRRRKWRFQKERIQRREQGGR